MKTTIVPAQVTTVEDKIAGNLGLSQILLLVAPIFFGSLVFVILPPFYTYATYKLAIIVIATCVCALLAIRIRGVIVLFWLRTLARYNSRPTYYLFDKNSVYLRDYTRHVEPKAVETVEAAKTPEVALRQHDAPRLEQVIAQHDAYVSLKTDKKGRLRVDITKVTSQGFGPAAD